MAESAKSLPPSLSISEPGPDDLERFGELVAEQLLEIRKAIPAPEVPLAPVVNVTTPAPVVNVDVQQPPPALVTVGFDIATIVTALDGASQGSKANSELIAKAIYDGMVRIAEALTAALTAPRELTMDAEGKPTGMVIRKGTGQ